MTGVRPAVWLLLMVLSACGPLQDSGLLPSTSPIPFDGIEPIEGPAAEVHVTQVTDGDTVHVEVRGRDVTIRLIGIDTPEVDWYGGDAECFGEEAGRYARGLLEGERVVLEHDEERADQYGRRLAYVYLDGRMVNLQLVRRGYARVTIYPPNDRYETQLRAAQSQARAAGLGLWGACD